MKFIKKGLQVFLNTPPHSWPLVLCRKKRGLPALLNWDALQDPTLTQPCLFVLSTGRVGTQSLAALLDLSPKIRAHHEPRPKLFGLSRLAYIHEGAPAVREVLQEAFLAARADLILESFACQYVYAETSPQATFLAPTIWQTCPSARFIHLVRHPASVVRSGMRRKWYQGQADDATRITPRPTDPFYKQWATLSPLEKNIWLWAETNRWILSFLEQLPPERRLFIQSESLFAGDKATIQALFAFAQTPLPAPKSVRTVLAKRLNAQSQGQFPPLEEWPQEWRQQLQRIAGEVATRLGYTL